MNTQRFQKSVRIPSRGYSLSGLLGKPTRVNSKRTARAVIFVHGFCGNKTENGLFTEAARELVARGFWTLSYDWRGLGESEGSFVETTLNDHVEDLKNVVSWVETTTNSNPKNIVALGFSLGATIIGIASSQMQIGRMVFWSPAFRPAVDMWPRYNSPKQIEELQLHGYITKPESSVKIGWGMIKSLCETDLGSSIRDFGIPMLICHGSADTRIPIKTTRDIWASVRKPSLLEFKGASHSFRPEDSYWVSLISETIDWLQRPNSRIDSVHRVLSPNAQRDLPRGISFDANSAAEGIHAPGI